MKATRIKNPMKELNRIGKIKANLEEKYQGLNKQTGEILKVLHGTPYRVTEVTGKLEEMRRKAMRVPEIRSMLARYKLAIEDVAFIGFWRERVDASEGRYSLEWGYSGIVKTLKDPTSNMWLISERYLYGGPQDRVKIIFGRSKNSTDCIYGFMAKSPVRLDREKRAA